MPDGTPPNSEYLVNRILTPKEKLQYGKGFKQRLKVAWKSHPVAIAIIKGKEYATDTEEYDDEDGTKWIHVISRVSNAPTRLVLKSQRFFPQRPGTFTEDTVELDDSMQNPFIGIRKTFMGPPSAFNSRDDQSNLYDSTRTIPLIEEAIVRVEKHL